MVARGDVSDASLTSKILKRNLQELGAAKNGGSHASENGGIPAVKDGGRYGPCVDIREVSFERRMGEIDSVSQSTSGDRELSFTTRMREKQSNSVSTSGDTAAAAYLHGESFETTRREKEGNSQSTSGDPTPAPAPAPAASHPPHRGGGVGSIVPCHAGDLPQPRDGSTGLATSSADPARYKALEASSLSSSFSGDMSVSKGVGRIEGSEACDASGDGEGRSQRNAIVAISRGGAGHTGKGKGGGRGVLSRGERGGARAPLRDLGEN
jgi:hypothetical protein